MSAIKHEMNSFNHDVPADETKLVNVNYNGKWIQVPAGLNVVEVTKRQGDFMPHYCYHPKLSISGNCRMCLFEMGMPKRNPDKSVMMGEDGKPELMWIPKPIIGCATPVSEGMGIRTESPLAKECRKSVMEFLLINHPLDCPICDQAGECKLQEYSSEYGAGESRFVEEKVKKPKNVDLGERIVLDDERCVLCARCIRFSKEMVKDDVLGFVDRGSHSKLAAHPGKRLDNAYSLNTVDICPVGALTSKDFRFKMRVWFLKETNSICTTCGTGCNVVIGERNNVIHRLTPRHNEAVNSMWMCDYGRLNFHYMFLEDRLQLPQVGKGRAKFPADWKAAFQQFGESIAGYKGEQIAMVASARMTNEELYLAKKWADELGVKQIDVVPRKAEGDGFLRSEDANPNSRGASLLGVSQNGSKLKEIVEGVRSGSLKVLIALHEDVCEAGFTEEDLDKLDVLLASGILKNRTTAKADFVFPGCAFAEKRGSMVNVHGRLQRLNRAIQGPGKAMEDWEMLCRLREATSGGNGLHTIEDVFRSMAADVKMFEGLSLSKIGDLGVDLGSESEPPIAG